MKFICLGYGDESKWDTMSPSEQRAMLQECIAFARELRSSGHWVDDGEALQGAETAKTLRQTGGKVMVTDGPFAETKEQLGGFFVFQADDMDRAIELVSRHPGLAYGPFEIRPLDEAIKELVAAGDS